MKVPRRVELLEGHAGTFVEPILDGLGEMDGALSGADQDNVGRGLEDSFLPLTGANPLDGPELGPVYPAPRVGLPSGNRLSCRSGSDQGSPFLRRTIRQNAPEPAWRVPHLLGERRDLLET